MPQDNLYIPPRNVAPSPRTGSGTTYHATTELVLWITLLLSIEVGLAALLSLMLLMELAVFFEYVAIHDANIAAFYSGHGCLSLLAVPVHLTCGVLLLVWIYLANKNVRALGARGMAHTPGWCVGWFFVPIANLFMPYQAIREIHQASDPEADALSWPNSRVSSEIGQWWGLVILCAVLGIVQLRLSLSIDRNVLVLGTWLGFCLEVLVILRGVLAIRIVRDIHSRQERKAAKMLQVEGVPVADHGHQPTASESLAQAEPAVLEKCPWCESLVVQPDDDRCPACDRPI